MDSIIAVMSALLGDLKEQVRDRLSWRKSIYVFTRSQNDLMARNQLMFYENHSYSLPKGKGCNGEIQSLYHFINLLK